MKANFVGALALLCFCGAAQAEFLERIDLRPAVASGFASHHLNTNRKFNEDNTGIGYRFGRADVLVGYYRNSHNKDSFYAAYEAQWQVVKHLRVGVLAGAVSGYGHTALRPLVLPEVVGEYRGVELAVTYAPNTPQNPVAVVAAQARWAW